MKTLDIYDLAIKSIRANKLRSRITIAIIALGITALVGILTAVDGIKNSIYSNFSGLGGSSFNITNNTFKQQGRKRVNSKHTLNLNNTITYDEAIAFKRRFDFPAIKSVNLLASTSAVIKRGTKKSNPNVFVMGIDENYFKVGGVSFLNGRSFTEHEIYSTTDKCIIGNGVAQQYFNRKPEQALNAFLTVGQRKYVVIGVLEEKGSSFIDRTDNMIFVSLANMKQVFGTTGKSYVITVKTNIPEQLDYAGDEAEGLMRAIKQLPLDVESNFSINKSDAVANSLIDNIKYVTIAASFIGFITLLGAAIGLMNILLVAVAERTREIGVSKAIGATSAVIKRQFLMESIIICITGGVIGIITGILIGNLVAKLVQSSFFIPWLYMLLSILVCLIVGVIAGIYPAVKASKLNPINVLRYE